MNVRWLAGCTLLCLASSAHAQDPTTLKTPREKLSYAIGVEFARSVKAQGVEIDPNILLMGLKDALAASKTLMTEAEIRSTMSAFQEDMKQKQMQVMEMAGEENKKAGEAFLAENAKKPGVVILPSGLQYKILKAAEGPRATTGDTVMCNYKGMFITGEEFDSSYDTGKPVPFDLSSIIPGFKEALLLMPVGSKWQVFIPSDLAYGERGAGTVIGPNAALIFELELVSIQKKP